MDSDKKDVRINVSMVWERRAASGVIEQTLLSHTFCNCTKEFAIGSALEKFTKDLSGDGGGWRMVMFSTNQAWIDGSKNKPDLSVLRYC